MISLITATYGRVVEFERLLQSLSDQTYKDFELIVIDQNEHCHLQDICARFGHLNIKYVRSGTKGLSYNRNIGLEHADGEIFGFPDDDCYYDNNLLQRVYENFSDSVDLKLVAVEAKDPLTNYVYRKKRRIKRANLFGACISYNFFIRRAPNIFFSEEFGVGAKYGSGEETDFLWEFFSTKDKGCFADSTYVYHPYGIVDGHKRYRYGEGTGAIFKKEIVKRHNHFMIMYYICSLLRSVAGCLVSTNHKSHLYGLKGKINGFLKYKP